MSSCRPLLDILPDRLLPSSFSMVAGAEVAEARVNLFRQHTVADHDKAVQLIPVIDYGPYLAGAPEALKRAAAEVAHGCERCRLLLHAEPRRLVRGDRACLCRVTPVSHLEQKLALRLNGNNTGYLPINASVEGASIVHKATRPQTRTRAFVTHNRGRTILTRLPGSRCAAATSGRRGCPTCTPT
jgi:hypothetical protein